MDDLHVSETPPNRDVFEMDNRRSDWEEAPWDQQQPALISKHQLQTSQEVENHQMSDATRMSPDLKRRRKLPSVLSEEEKHLVTVEMQESKLGVLCNVCGKMLKNKDALNFHIMNTKLPGHEAALQQVAKKLLITIIAFFLFFHKRILWNVFFFHVHLNLVILKWMWK